MNFLQKYRILDWLILGMAFLLPIHPRLFPPLLILLGVSTFFVPGYLTRLLALTKSFPFWIFVSCFFIYLLGMCWTSAEGKELGWSTIETKLSFFFVPLIFWTIPSTELPQKKRLKKYFILGVIFSLLLCTIIGVHHLIDERIDMAHGIARDNFRYYWFFSDRLSIFIHPTYLSMYANAALAMLLFAAGRNLFRRLSFWFIVSVLFLGIFMLASKAGLITMILLMLVFSYRLLFIEKKVMQAISGLVVVFLLFFAAYFTIGEFRNKIRMVFHAVENSREKQTNEESSAMRVEVWKAGMEVASKNLPFGTGTGDGRGELMSVYKERGLIAEASHQLNAHNQFLQATITVGIAGLLILLTWMLTFSTIFIRAKELDGLWIMILFLINNLVECMLEVQAGIFFFTFFIALYFAYAKMERKVS